MKVRIIETRKYLFSPNLYVEPLVKFYVGQIISADLVCYTVHLMPDVASTHGFGENRVFACRKLRFSTV